MKNQKIQGYTKTIVLWKLVELSKIYVWNNLQSDTSLQYISRVPYENKQLFAFGYIICKDHVPYVLHKIRWCYYSKI